MSGLNDAHLNSRTASYQHPGHSPLPPCVQVGGSTRPVRVRVLDLPFTAVEWVLPSEMTHASAEALSPAKWMVWERSPLAKERSLQVGTCWAMSGITRKFWGGASAPCRWPPAVLRAPEWMAGYIHPQAGRARAELYHVTQTTCIVPGCAWPVVLGKWTWTAGASLCVPPAILEGCDIPAQATLMTSTTFETPGTFACLLQSYARLWPSMPEAACQRCVTDSD